MKRIKWQKERQTLHSSSSLVVMRSNCLSLCFVCCVHVSDQGSRMMRDTRLEQIPFCSIDRQHLPATRTLFVPMHESEKDRKWGAGDESHRIPPSHKHTCSLFSLLRDDRHAHTNISMGKGATNPQSTRRGHGSAVRVLGPTPGPAGRKRHKWPDARTRND